MASLWNLKHRHRPERSSWGKSEYQQPFRSACTCSPHVTAPFSSTPTPRGETQRAISEVIYTLVLCIEWRPLLTAFWNTIGFLLRVMRSREGYGLGEGIDYMQRQSAAFAVWSVFTSFLWQYSMSSFLETKLKCVRSSGRRGGGSEMTQSINFWDN